MAPGAKVQASKLSPVVDEAMVRTLFEILGPIDNLVLIPSPIGAGYEAIIEFRDPEAASTATHLTGTLFGGRALTITQMEQPIIPAGLVGARPTSNLIQQGVAPGTSLTAAAPNNMIRMGPTILHPQFNGMGGAVGGQFPPMYHSPHMTLYNPNILPPQFQQQLQQQQRPMDQAVDLEKVDSRTVYVGNLPLAATKEQLEEVFQDCGTITRVNIAGKAMHPTRFAFIDFETIDGAKKALASIDKVIGDRTLKINLPRHHGPLPFMMQQAQMMQAPPVNPPAMDSARMKQKNILIGLVNRGGDPSLLKLLEEIDAGGPLPDLSALGISADGTMKADSPSNGVGSPTTSSSRRVSRSRSRPRRRSRSRSHERDYYRSSRRRRSPSRSPSRYSRSSRGYEADYGRHEYRDRERESSRSGRSRGYRDASRDRERDRGRDRERERERDRHRSARGLGGESEHPREKEGERLKAET